MKGVRTEYSYDNFENGLTPNESTLLAICAITSHLKFSDLQSMGVSSKLSIVDQIWCLLCILGAHYP
jgi:hypothetical protein